MGMIGAAKNGNKVPTKGKKVAKKTSNKEQ
jgi:hypothetical protein